ncbi:MAG: sn-glycerol-3-phosphate ABC transporter ATP-binding protein UgpC [Gemmatimonadales bacterium]|jgi:multiple sugar transport system ATP-binding protein
MGAVRLDSVTKVYPNGHIAARGLDLDVADGEFVVLVGPSGCGKSTALRMVAGLETPSSGQIWIGGRDCTDVPPQERDIAMVFQTYALYPHKTIRENLGFGLRMRGHGAADVEERVARAAAALGLDELLDRKPAQLSGGQRQRVALGRAIVREPQAFLLDEPLSNLDAKLRVQTRAELGRLHRRLGATMLYVTHDQEEAMTLGDRVAILDGGVIQQVAPPMEVYRRPANRFVAGFIGSPAMNFFTGEIRRTEDGASFEAGSLLVPLPRDRESPAGGPAVLGVRPHDIRLCGAEDGDVSARVDVVEPMGAETLVHLALGVEPATPDVRAVVPAETGVEEEDTVGLHLHRDRLHLFAVGDGNRLN